MHIKFERVPETDRMEDWVSFEKKINALAEQGYKITEATVLRRALSGLNSDVLKRRTGCSKA